MTTTPQTPSDAFLTSGISLGIPNDNAVDISTLDNAISVTPQGELIFKDNYTQNLTDVNGNPIPYIKLKDLSIFFFCFSLPATGHHQCALSDLYQCSCEQGFYSN